MDFLTVAVENAYRQLPIAHEYQIQDVVDLCEEKIIADQPKISNTKLADDLGLQKLRDHCLKTVGTYFPLADIKGDETFDSLSDETKCDILAMRVQTMETKIHNGSWLANAVPSDYCSRHMTSNRRGDADDSCEVCTQVKRNFYTRLFPKT